MDNQTAQNEDILKEYIYPGSHEKAPEGFLMKTMARVRIEAGSVPAVRRHRFRNFVPLTAGLITIALILSVIVAPGNGDSFLDRIAEGAGFIKVSLPQLNTDIFRGFTFPPMVIYVLVGIIMLVIFDRLLSFFFRRKV